MKRSSCSWIAYIAANELYLCGEICRQAIRMDLLAEIVVNAYLVVLLYECAHQMGADKTGPAGDQYFFRRHSRSLLSSGC